MDKLGELVCTKCGIDCPVGSGFCSGCGQSLEPASANTGDHAERKQVTISFSDMTGFTALTEKLDPEETRKIMGQVFAMAADVVGRYEGRIGKFVGDAIMAIFGVPLAHEDDPQRAVRAAMELHDAVASLSPDVEARNGVALSMHSGGNTGVVVTGELQFDHGTAGPLGDTINIAARLMNGAPSGQIWVGPETIQLVANEFEFDDLGEMDFKGKASAISVASIVRAREQGSAPDQRQLRGDFVGRHGELGELLDASEKIRDGHAQIIGVCGDAGTGKSRLVHEFRHKLGSDVQWIEGRAYPYAKDTPYALFIDLTRRAWQIEETDTPGELRAKIFAGVQSVLGEDDAAQSLYLHLFNLDQAEGVVIEREAFRERLLKTTQRVLAALAKRAPLVVCLQDLHWADPSSVRMLADLVGILSPGVMLMGNYRPEFTPPPGTKQVKLTELSSRQSGELLKSLLQGELPEAFISFVTERSDGNPFYIEELVNSLVETGALVQTDSGWSLARPLTETSVPATIRGVIEARIDRLEASRRQLLRHAAVVGREFLVKIVSLIGVALPI